MFNRYGISASFNLNSALADYVWHLGDNPIRRLNLEKDYPLYRGHEIASHTLTHPDLAYCSEEDILRQVGEDIENLSRIFQTEVSGFATPFESSEEREVNIIKRIAEVKYIRLSKIDESFAFPPDPFHFRVTALDIDRALALFEGFKRLKGDGLFLYAGHSYDFALARDGYAKLEALLQQALACKDINILPLGEIAKQIF